MALGLLALAAAGCATAPDVPEVTRLQAQAVYERGLVHWREGQASLALSSLREAVSLNPQASTYRDSLGLLYLQLRRADLAIAEFEEAVRLDPQHGDATDRDAQRDAGRAERRRVHQHEPGEPVGPLDGGPHADAASPVVGDEGDVAEVERVDQPDQVRDVAVEGVVVVPRLVRPAAADVIDG